MVVVGTATGVRVIVATFSRLTAAATVPTVVKTTIFTAFFGAETSAASACIVPVIVTRMMDRKAI